MDPSGTSAVHPPLEDLLAKCKLTAPGEASFEKFPMMPVELQKEIFGHALEEETRSGRVVMLWKGRVMPFKNLVSPLLTANSVSRECALKFYTTKVDIFAMPRRRLIPPPGVPRREDFVREQLVEEHIFNDVLEAAGGYEDLSQTLPHIVVQQPDGSWLSYTAVWKTLCLQVLDRHAERLLDQAEGTQIPPKAKGVLYLHPSQETILQRYRCGPDFFSGGRKMLDPNLKHDFVWRHFSAKVAASFCPDFGDAINQAGYLNHRTFLVIEDSRVIFSMGDPHHCDSRRPLSDAVHPKIIDLNESPPLDAMVHNIRGDIPPPRAFQALHLTAEESDNLMALMSMSPGRILGEAECWFDVKLFFEDMEVEEHMELYGLIRKVQDKLHVFSERRKQVAGSPTAADPVSAREDQEDGHEENTESELEKLSRQVDHLVKAHRQLNDTWARMVRFERQHQQDTERAWFSKRTVDQ